MTDPSILRKRFTPSGYAWPCLFLFLWFFLIDGLDAFDAVVPFIRQITFVFSLFVGPLFFAGFFYSVVYCQKTGEPATPKVFVKGIQRHYSMFLVANTLVLLLSFVLVFAQMKLTGSDVAASGGAEMVWRIIISMVISVVKISWYAALAVLGGNFAAGFFSAARLFFTSRSFAVGALVWGAFYTIDYMIDTRLGSSASSDLVKGLSGLRDGILVFAALFASVRTVTGALLSGMAAETETDPDRRDESQAPTYPKKLRRTPLWLVMVSFIPVVSLFSFIWGLLSIRDLKGRSLRSLSACTFGGFFSALYAILIAGIFLTHNSQDAEKPVGYGFISREQPKLCPHVAVLDSGYFVRAQALLNEIKDDDLKKTWPYLAAMGIANHKNGDSLEAEDNYLKALGLAPHSGELHYFYGRYLLDHGRGAEAENHFIAAREKKPGLAGIDHHIRFAKNLYEPSRAERIMWSILILIILFTFHEYGHAFSAWKLGDDTAKNAGRLTLNPFPHLDLFGSLLLPGILLFRNSDFLIGWAKPVPVDRSKFLDPRHDDMLVSFAGPFVNLLLALAAFLLLALFVLTLRLVSPDAVSTNLAEIGTPFAIVGEAVPLWAMPVIAFLKQFLYTSLILGCFNLIPIPPLDGSWILSGLLPERMNAALEKFRQYSFIVLLVLILTPVFDYLLAVPVGIAMVLLGLCFGAFGMA